MAPYLTLMTEDAPQREHSLRDVYNGLRWIVRAGAAWRMMPDNLPPWHTVYQQSQRWLKAGVFETAVDTLGYLLALLATPANEQSRHQVAELAKQVQEATGDSVELAFVDQAYTGERAAQDATANYMELEVVKLSEAKRGFVLLPRRWVVERSQGWAARFRRLARDYEQLAETLKGLHVVAFAILMLKQLTTVIL